MTVQFELEGQPFLALNGGPMFRFNEAVSLMVSCHTQDEIDHYWSRLSDGGDPAARQCGWLKDRYGLSWQIVPAQMASWMGGPDAAAAQRVMQALDRKSTRLNSSHLVISYAVFCLKKKKRKHYICCVEVT